MTEDKSPNLPPPLGDDTPPLLTEGRGEGRGDGEGRSGLRLLGWLVVMVAVVAGIGTLVWHYYGEAVTGGESAEVTADSLPSLAGRVRAVENALGGIDRKVEALDSRLNDLKGNLPDSGATPVAPAEVAALRDRLNALEKAVAGLAEQTIDKTPPTAPAAPPSLSSADLARLAQVERDLAALRTDQGKSASREALDKLDGRISDLAQAQNQQLGAVKAEADRMAGAARGIALVYGLARLRDGLHSGLPYDQALAAVNRQAKALALDQDQVAATALKALAPTAAQGIESLTALTGRFDGAARAAIEADALPDNASFLDRLGAEASNLITIRPVGAVEGAGTAPRIARAETDLARGRLDLAVAELDALGAKPKAALADWLTPAKARLAAEAALDHLDSRIAERFAADPAGQE